MPRPFLAFAALALCAPLFPLAAQDHDHVSCTAGNTAPFPPGLENWDDRYPIGAARRVSQLDTATLQLGRAYDTALIRTRDVRYVKRPEKPGGSVSYGGLFAIDIEQPGIYRVALGSAAWVDVLRGDTVIQSGKFGHGPDCTGIRKMVEFTLDPGSYTIQIAANGEADLPLAVALVP